MNIRHNRIIIVKVASHLVWFASQQWVMVLTTQVADLCKSSHHMLRLPSFLFEGHHATEGQPAGRHATDKVSGRQRTVQYVSYVMPLSLLTITPRLLL